ncbi:hypothetical protein HPB47_021056 [Ixodes persulcatus]|uniref:Uncharacterized protein n=1 Tax=Ixodes persulcatus TaxID=34615 RepID=A0AC60QDN9_IXOPE|nr:hypothetical protein HPB47_021056 [Ixodes persulcatus]
MSLGMMVSRLAWVTVDQLAASLLSLQLPMGSRVGILAPNLYEVALLSFAAAKAGLVMVGLSPLCTLSGMEFSLHEKVLQVKRKLRCPTVAQLFSAEELLDASLPSSDKATDQSLFDGAVTFDDLMKSATAEDQAALSFVSAKVQFDQDAFIQFSSGTTGHPKSVRLTHFNVVNNANLVGRILGYHQQHESICLFRELVFGFGRTLGLLAAMLFGSTIVLPAPSFSAKATLEAISKHRCTVIYGSPTSYINLLSELDQGEYVVSSLRKGMMAAAMCSPELVDKARERLNIQRLHIMFGASETSPNFTSTNPDEPIDEWIRTIGTPMEHVEVKVVDAEGRIVPVNTRGELCTRGPHVFKGYLNDDAKTKEAIRDGWYHTGDDVTMSKDGRMTFIGRIKETINTAGWNVSPLEIESVLNAHADVEEAQVTGVPDKIMGEKICAWIKLKPGKTSSHEKIKTFCAGKNLREILVMSNEELRKVNEEIEPHISDIDLETDYITVAEYEEEVARTVRELRNKIARLQATPTAPATGADGDRGHPSQATGVKLPKLHLLLYQGELKLWQPFMEQFDASIYWNTKLFDGEKFQSPRSLLIAPAAAADSGLQAMAACYRDAIDILTERFGDK